MLENLKILHVLFDEYNKEFEKKNFHNKGVHWDFDVVLKTKLKFPITGFWIGVIALSHISKGCFFILLRFC